VRFLVLKVLVEATGMFGECFVLMPLVAFGTGECFLDALGYLWDWGMFLLDALGCILGLGNVFFVCPGLFLGLWNVFLYALRRNVVYWNPNGRSSMISCVYALGCFWTGVFLAQVCFWTEGDAQGYFLGRWKCFFDTAWPCTCHVSHMRER